MRIINKAVIHYTASDDIPISTVRQWHLDKGWQDVGYHKLIRRDGSVELGRPESEQGAHVKGFNKESLGVVLTGSDDLSWYPSAAQLTSLKRVVKEWQDKYNIQDRLVLLHKQLNQTSCPGRLTLDFMKEETKTKRREPMIQTGKLHDWIVVPQDKALHITNTDDGDEITVKRRFLDEFGNEQWKDEEYIGAGKTWSMVITQFGYIRLKSGANFVSRVE